MYKRKDTGTSIGRLIEEVKQLPAGQKLLDAIDRECGYNRVVFNPSSEAQNTFNQGKQALSIWLHDHYEKHINKMKDE